MGNFKNVITYLLLHTQYYKFMIYIDKHKILLYNNCIVKKHRLNWVQKLAVLPANLGRFLQLLIVCAHWHNNLIIGGVGMNESYLGKSNLILSVGIILCLLAALGLNTYISISKERIEVRTSNSNSLNNAVD